MNYQSSFENDPLVWRAAYGDSSKFVDSWVEYHEEGNKVMADFYKKMSLLDHEYYRNKVNGPDTGGLLGVQMLAVVQKAINSSAYFSKKTMRFEHLSLDDLIKLCSATGES